MKITLKRIAESLLILAISAALWQVALIPIAKAFNEKLALSTGQNIYAFVSLLLLVFLINWYATKQNYLNWKSFSFDKDTVKWLLVGVVATFVLHFLATGVGFLEGTPYLDTNRTAEGYYIVVDFMLVCLLSPVAEELVFREILTKVIFPKNLKISLVVTGIIFTVIHLPITAGDWVNQLGAAVILSMIYYKTKRVELCILVHSFMNLFVTLNYWWVMFR